MLGRGQHRGRRPVRRVRPAVRRAPVRDRGCCGSACRDEVAAEPCAGRRDVRRGAKDDDRRPGRGVHRHAVGLEDGVGRQVHPVRLHPGSRTRDFLDAELVERSIQLVGAGARRPEPERGRAGLDVARHILGAADRRAVDVVLQPRAIPIGEGEMSPGAHRRRRELIVVGRPPRRRSRGQQRAEQRCAVEAKLILGFLPHQRALGADGIRLGKPRHRDPGRSEVQQRVVGDAQVVPVEVLPHADEADGIQRGALRGGVEGVGGRIAAARLVHVPDCHEVRIPCRPIGRVGRRRCDGTSPIRPDRRVGVHQLGDAHPDERVARRVPLLDLVGQLHQSRRVREAQVGAAGLAVVVGETRDRAGTEHHQRREVGERLRAFVAGERDRRLPTPSGEIGRLERRGCGQQQQAADYRRCVVQSVFHDFLQFSMFTIVFCNCGKAKRAVRSVLPVAETQISLGHTSLFAVYCRTCQS